MNNIILTIILNNEEIETFKELVKYITINPLKDPSLYCQQVKNLCEHIPDNIKDQLHNFNTGSNFNTG